MVLKRRARLFLGSVLLVLLSVFSAEAINDSIPSWSDEQWEKAIEGLDYSNPDKPEPSKEKERFNTDQSNNEGRSFLDWLNYFLTGNSGRTIVLIVVVGLLAYTLFRLLSQASVNKDKKIQADLAYHLEHLEDHFEESDMDRLLRLALEGGDLKTGVRILYLALLQQLHLKSWIVWKKDKTNRDFLIEMKAHTDIAKFRELTRAYEIVWYGDTEIRLAEFDRLKVIFQSFTSTIQNQDNAQG